MRALGTAVSAWLILGLLGETAGAVTIETVPVGNLGNAGELSGSSVGGYGYGADRICGFVNYTYNIGKYEVTAGQYAAFLNATAKTDTYGLYDVRMNLLDTAGCRIARNGTSGRYTYSVAADWTNRPVNYVSFWDAARFANWLHNGQPTGPQGPGTTETGAYTLDGYNGSLGTGIQRNSNWTWGITSEDEWYKAAYHRNDGATGNYYKYPTASDVPPANVLTTTDPGNTSTYLGTNLQPYVRTEVGEHENSASPYGTFDQGGNVWEWNDTVSYADAYVSYRALRGGSTADTVNALSAALRTSYSPSDGASNKGFRVVQVPEPAAIIMFALGSLGTVRRRRHDLKLSTRTRENFEG